MFRKIHLLLALVAVAIAAPIAQAKPVDPLAVSVLQARGWSASRIDSWTTGACSYTVKPATCYLTPAQAALSSEREAESMGVRPFGITRSASARSVSGGFDRGDPGLAQGILESQFGFSTSRAIDWTTGVCSYQVKPSSCYLTPREAQMQSRAEAIGMGTYRPVALPASASTPSGGFNWEDAGIGAAATLGLVLLAGALGLAVLGHTQRRHPKHA